MAARNAKRSISTTLRKNRGLWTVYGSCAHKILVMQVLYGVLQAVSVTEYVQSSQKFITRVFFKTYWFII